METEIRFWGQKSGKKQSIKIPYTIFQRLLPHSMKPTEIVFYFTIPQNKPWLSPSFGGEKVNVGIRQALERTKIHYFMYPHFSIFIVSFEGRGTYGGWIYSHLCNQCLYHHYLTLWVRIPGSSTKRTDRHDISGILLKVALNTIAKTNQANHPWKRRSLWNNNLPLLQY